MAELKTRILLRNDTLANWLAAEQNAPDSKLVLGKGELAVVYDPTVAGDRKIRVKIGDGVSTFSALPYIGGEGEGTFASLSGYARDNADLRAELEALEAAISTKVDGSISGSNGTAKIFNEYDGGGVQFINADGTTAFVGVNDGGLDGKGVVLYDKKADGTGARINLTTEGAYYYTGANKAAADLTPEDEIAVKGDLAGATAELEAELAEKADTAYVDAELAKKVAGSIQGVNGTAQVFNEQDGGGVKFVNNDGVESFVGVNDGGENGLAAQIYADKLNSEGKWEGAKLDVTNNGIYYTVGDDTFADRAVESNELATKGVVDSKIAAAIAELPNITYTFEEMGEPRAEVDFNVCHKIFLKPEDNLGSDVYEEYICLRVNDAYRWEKIGNTRVDLQNYYTKSETDAKVLAEQSRAQAIEATKLEAYQVTVDGQEGQYVGPANVPVFFELASDGDSVTVNAHNIVLNTESDQTAFVTSMAVPNASAYNTGLLSRADYGRFDAKQDAITIINCGDANS